VAFAGSRLFINMRLAASASHDRAVFVVPLGARIGSLGFASMCIGRP